jgi:hypothetical protein
MRREDGTVLVDLHLHSWASGTATNWWVNGLGADVEARESYTPPEDAYRMAKKAGMDFVTLTDHETIDGALTLAHQDFFVGEEVSAYLPEEDGYVDILVYGLDREVHREAQARRYDAHELVGYLREAGVVHVLAHPIYAMPGPLDRRAVEKRLVMFGLWEFINGSRPWQQNRLAREIAEGVGQIELRQMAMRHGLPVPPHQKISGTGGSDDHGGIYGGVTHTVLPRVESTNELLEAMAAGEVRPAGEDGTVAKMVHTGFGLAGAAIEEGEEGRAVRVLRGLTLRPAFLRRSRGAPPGPERELLKNVPLLSRLKETRIRAELTRRYEERLSGSLGNVGSGFPALDFVSSIGSFVDGHVFIAPYAGVHGYFGREKKKTRDLRRELMPGDMRGLKVGVFVDGMDGIHGVGTMYRNVQALAGEERGDLLRIVRCGPDEDPEPTPPSKGGVHSLRQVAAFPVPLYDGLVLGCPPSWTCSSTWPKRNTTSCTWPPRDPWAWRRSWQAWC